MRKKAATKAGNIFAFDRNDGTFGFGRVLLDIENQCVKSGKVAPRSPLLNFPKALLIEIFAESAAAPMATPTKIGMRGIPIAPDVLRNGHWPVIGTRPIDPAEVEFPENLIAVGLKAEFNRGEIALPIALSHTELDAISAFPRLAPSDAVLHISRYYTEGDGKNGRGVPPPLEHGDLRFSLQRERVYQLLGEDPAQSYAQMARRHGFDLSRFYDA
jgi:hypothetical protein